MSIAQANRHTDLSRRLMEQGQLRTAYHGRPGAGFGQGFRRRSQGRESNRRDRNWRHRSHNLRRDIVGLLADEFQQPQMLYLQAIADPAR